MALRRYVFPILWLAVFAVLAAALFKLAFVDGMRAEASTEQPYAQLSTPVVPAVLGTVTNLIQVQGSVVSDPAVTVKSTTDGTVEFIYVEAGEQVAKGAALFQVKKLLETPVTGTPDPEEPPAPMVPLYTYIDVTATADGMVTDLMVLKNQQLSVGTEVAALDPGTFSVQGTLDTAQQFRILERANNATVSINGGPAPFHCSNVSMGKGPAAATGISTQAVGPAAVGPAQPDSSGAGSVSCSVPAGIAVFSGLGAAIDITAGQADGVVTVPTTAVQGAVQAGIVWIADPAGSSEPVQRDVVLGLNDGQTVEIVSGLQEGETVLQFVPGAPAQDDPMGGMGGYAVMGG